MARSIQTLLHMASGELSWTCVPMKFMLAVTAISFGIHGRACIGISLVVMLVAILMLSAMAVMAT